MTIQAKAPRNKGLLTWDERCLEPQAIARLPGLHTGDAIVCTCGTLWVTQEGDPEDYLLRKGSLFVANRQGLVLVQALTKARYRISSSYNPHGWTRRIGGRAPPHEC